MGWNQHNPEVMSPKEHRKHLTYPSKPCRISTENEKGGEGGKLSPLTAKFGPPGFTYKNGRTHYRRCHCKACYTRRSFTDAY